MTCIIEVGQINKRVVNQITGIVNKAVEKSVISGLAKGALGFQMAAREELTKKVHAKGGKESGRLASAILVKKADTGQPGYWRYDIVVDLARAPYAMWVEYGRTAPYGLPYEKSGKKDYSKSKFKGHWYLRRTLQNFTQNPIIQSHIISRLVKELSKAKRWKSVGKLHFAK